MIILLNGMRNAGGLLLKYGGGDMPRVAVMTDSNSGITQLDGKNMGVGVMPMPFTIDGKIYYEDVSLSREEFFQMMADDKNILSSQPAPADLLEMWDKALEKNDQIVYIPMSSGLSGSCQNARMLANDYHGKVYVVNNQRISVTQKRSVQDALQMAANGMDAARIREVLERERFDSSIYIMRLAEIYLLHAEALACTGDLAGAAGYVNRVRSRAKLADLPASAQASQEAMIDAILKERRLELAFEGFRFFDLARHDRIIEVHNSVNAKDSYWQVRKPLTETRIFLPIPTSALEQNSALTQNPGY